MKKLEQVEKPSYWSKYKFYLLTFMLALIVFGVCAYLVGRVPRMYLLEYKTLMEVNSWPDKLRLFFVPITLLGSIWTAAISVVAAFFLRLYQLAWRFALSVFTVYGLQIVLKNFFDRPRPEQFESTVVERVAETGFAFPSTHAAIATVLALTLLPYLPRGWRWAMVVGAILAVALSRVYLGVHAPLDVVAGVALGAGVVCFWRIMPKPIKKILHLK
jgi:membrane-associated phospholipid phosphatase